MGEEGDADKGHRARRRRGVALAQIFQPMVFTATAHGKILKQLLKVDDFTLLMYAYETVDSNPIPTPILHLLAFMSQTESHTNHGERFAV